MFLRAKTEEEGENEKKEWINQWQLCSILLLLFNCKHESYEDWVLMKQLALSPQSKKVLGLNPSQDVFVRRLHVLPVSAWVYSGFSSFLPQSKNM